MNRDVAVVAAGYMTPEGYGSGTRGRCSWLDDRGQPCRREELMDISWSSLFAAPCSRFGRMSPLARLGLMTVELLDAGFAGMTEEQRTDTGVCMVSPLGSIATDIEFLREIGPAAFTYTLPSSVLGEVCIRHRLRGPGLCLMSGGNAGRGLVEEAAERIARGEAGAMVCLVCEAAGSEARNLLHYTLDKDGNFCWYAYGLCLARSDMAREPGQSLVKERAPCGADIRGICLDFCAHVQVVEQSEKDHVN